MEEVHDFDRSPEADVIDTVAHLQLEVEALKFVQAAPLALTWRTLPVLSKPVAFTSTKVPKLSWGTSWDQYRQVFDAIVRFNGSDDHPTTLVPPGRRRIECGPAGARGGKGHAGCLWH